MSVHYKFKSALSYDTLTFDGLHISIRDLKKSILQQKQIGKGSDFDLQITNAQSNEVYDDDNTLVPKNSSLIVVRIPLTTQQKKAWEKSENLQTLGNKAGGELDPHANKLAKTVDLANVDASEADKIQAAITQSTLDYDPSNYLRIKGSNQVGELPLNYRCYKCNQPGHWIKDCKISAPTEANAIDIKKSTGIPQSFMVPVAGPGVPGAMMTPTGHYAVPSIEHEARKEPMRKPVEPVHVEKPSIPDDLICGVCKDLLVDAVLIPCCGNSFCDECIRNVLLESEDHQCPDCREKDVSPDTLLPNRFLRNSVTNFRNQTGYCRTAPSFLQSKMAAQTEAHAPHVEPHHTSQDAGQNSTVPPQPPRQHSPIRHVKDNHGHAHRRPERLSPDDVQIVDDSSRLPAPGTIPALGSGDGSHVSTISSVSQPVYNVGTHKSYHDNGDYRKSDYHAKGDYHKRPPYKQHFIRHDRSDTPTVDERSGSVEPVLYPIESIAPMSHPPRMMLNQRPPAPPGVVPPMIYPQGNFPMFRPNYPHPPPRHDLPPFPPGTDHIPPRMGHYRAANNYYPPRQPRPHFRPSHSSEGPVSSGPIDDPYMEFQRLLAEKDLGRRRTAARRRSSRSLSRSPYSRSISPRPRSRIPRSRSRSRSSARVPKLRSRSPRSPRSPVLRSRSRSIRRRSRSRSFTISRSRSPPPHRSPRSYLSRTPPPSPLRDRDRHYSPPPRRRDDRRSPPPRHSPVRYYSRGYKEEYGPPPKDRDREPPRPIERLDRNRDRDRDRDPRPRSRDRVERDRDRDRGTRYTKPSSVVQQEFYSSSSQDYNRHPGDRYEPKEGRYSGPRDRDRNFEKDRDRDRDRSYKPIPSLIDIHTTAPPGRYDSNFDTRERIARDWEKTRDRELELQERERERQAAALAPPGEYVEKLPAKKREPSRGRPVEPLSNVPRHPPPPAQPEERLPNVNVLTYVTPKESPLKEVPPDKSPDREKKEKVKEKKKKKKEESEKKEKKKKKKMKEKSDKKESSEPGDVTSNTAEDIEEETKLSEDVSVQEDPLYGELAVGSDIVDSTVVENYSKPTDVVKEEVKKDVVLAPVPELSKWEKDDEPPSQSEEHIQENGSENKQVTSEVLKRAENAIFKKSINPIGEKKTERKPDVKKSSKEREKAEGKEEKVKEEKPDVKEKIEIVEKPKDKEVRASEKESRASEKESRAPEKESPSRREKPEKRDERERRDDRDRREDRDRDRYRERRDQEREREHKARVLDREKERQIAISRDAERDRYHAKEHDAGRSSDRKVETIPLRISAKERLGAKVEDKTDVKKRLDKREVKAEKPKRKDEVREEKKKDDERIPSDVIVNQVAVGEPPVVKKRSVSLDADRLVKKIKLTQEDESSADSSASSDESISDKKRKKKKKKKHKKKKKKRKHSSSDSDSSSSSSDSDHEKKRKHKKSKKSKKKKKSKK